MTTRSYTTGETFQHAASGFYQPRQGSISDAEMKVYLKRARDLRAQAFHDAARGLLTAIHGIGAKARQSSSDLRHSTLLRAPGSGNCLNC